MILAAVVILIFGALTALTILDRGRPMPISIGSRKPVCNITGALLPFVTLLVLFLTDHVADMNGLSNYEFDILLVFLCFVSILISFLLSILSVYRRERFQVLTYIELVIYGILSFVVLAAFLQ